MSTTKPMTFTPNALTFQQGVERIAAAAHKRGFDANSRIWTSRDVGAVDLQDALEVTNIPAGFTKFQLPFALSRCQMFVTSAPARAKVPTHSHDEGAGVRFIVAGSIRYNEVELKAGDWMYIPAGKKYSFEVGALGATMFYCYECCCA